jgi:DNA-directed RNA polymerase specialized sigma24 family protein
MLFAGRLPPQYFNGFFSGSSQMTPATHEVTKLLKAWSGGDESALDKLMPLVYDEFHRLARGHMRREKPGHLLQTSALVNEAYLRLVDASQVRWQNRAHFFGIAARLMRRILVDDARRRHFEKRGGRTIQVPLDDAARVPQEQAPPPLSLPAEPQVLRSVRLAGGAGASRRCAFASPPAASAAAPATPWDRSAGRRRPCRNRPAAPRK